MRVIGLVTLLLLAFVPSAAPELWLDTQPARAHVEIRGQVSMFGSAPLPVADLPTGDYNLIADEPGFPVVKGRLLYSGDRLWTRPWAGPNTLLLPPGITHLQREEARGWAFLTGGVLGATMAAVSQSDLSDREAQRDRAEDVYRLATSEDDLARAGARLEVAARAEDDARQIRNLWLAYLAVSWVDAGLEATLLTPRPAVTANGSHNYLLTLQPVSPVRAGLGSLIAVGGGQRYLGHERRGNWFLVGTGLAAAGTIFAQEEYLKAHRDQLTAQLRFDRATSEAELDAARAGLQSAADEADDRNLIRWLLIGATTSLYVWNVVDAILLAVDHDTGWTEAAASGRDPALLAKCSRRISIVPTGDGAFVSLNWSLQ